MVNVGFIPAQGGGSITNASDNYAVLRYISATIFNLDPIEAGTQDFVVVNGESVSLTPAKTNNIAADNTITAVGADSGGTPGASTTYYTYLSNSSATTFPEEVRLSTTAPTSGYLGAAGNAANWRYLGEMQTNGATQIVNGQILQASLLPKAPGKYVSWHNAARIISGNAITSTIDGNQAKIILFYQNPSAIADSFEHDFWIDAGEYNLRRWGMRTAASGILDWSIDGSVVAAGEDWDSGGGVVYNVVLTTAVTITSPGKHTVTGTIVGTNSGGFDWRGSWVYFEKA